MRLAIRVGWVACVMAFLLGLAQPAAADSVECAEDNGTCMVSNDMGDWVECECADGGGFGGSGGNEYDGLTEDELLEICYGFLEDCGFVPPPPPSSMCETEEGSCVVGSSPPSYACDCEVGPSAFGDGEDEWEGMTQEELDAVCVALVPTICTGGGSESSTTEDPSTTSESETDPTTATDDSGTDGTSDDSGTDDGTTTDHGTGTDTDPSATATVTDTDATATATDTDADSSGGDSTDASATDASADASATDPTADDDDATASADDGDEESTGSDTAGSSDDAGGCGCRTSEPSSAFGLALLLGLVLRRRRG